MLSEELKTRLLDARDARQVKLGECIEDWYETVLMLSVNIPGPDKKPAGAKAVFELGCVLVAKSFDVKGLQTAEDDAGYFAFFMTKDDAVSAKRKAVEIEESSPQARLLDIDIYSGGVQTDRKSLGLPPRKCLVCGLPAAECMRERRHDADTVIAETEKLLSR